MRHDFHQVHESHKEKESKRGRGFFKPIAIIAGGVIFILAVGILALRMG